MELRALRDDEEGTGNILPRLQKSQMIVLEALRKHGACTDQETYQRLIDAGERISASGARSRRSELMFLGLVRDTGRREKVTSGRWGAVWEAV